MIKPFVFAVSFSYPTHFLDDYFSGGWLTGPCETVLGCKTGRRLKKIYISERQRMNLQLQDYKVNDLRKGRSGICSQEETCLKFRQVEGNILITNPFYQLKQGSLSVTSENREDMNVSKDTKFDLVKEKQIPSLISKKLVAKKPLTQNYRDKEKGL